MVSIKTDLLIVGAGPAALAAALPFLGDQRDRLIVDIAEPVPDDVAQRQIRLIGLTPEKWDAEDRLMIRLERQAGNALPFKTWLGSDYATRRGNTVVDASNREILKCAGTLGGLSRIWGATLARWPDCAFNNLPLSGQALSPHYQAIEALIPSTRRAENHLAHLTGQMSPEIVCEPATVAINSSRCICCNGCMYGCAQNAIFTAADWLPSILGAGFQLVQGLRVVKIREDGKTVVAEAVDLGGEGLEIRTDRAIIGCGAISSCKLILDSWPIDYPRLRLADSQYFIVPFLGTASSDESADALAQSFVSVSLTGGSGNPAMFQIYASSPALRDELEFKLRALPRLLRKRITQALAARLIIAQGYLHSADSGNLELQSNSTASRITALSKREQSTRKLASEAIARLAGGLRSLGYQRLPTIFASVGAGYHCGNAQYLEIGKKRLFDDIGQLDGLERVHFVDGAALPAVAAGPITLTIMANAHRIATYIRADIRD